MPSNVRADSKPYRMAAACMTKAITSVALRLTPHWQWTRTLPGDGLICTWSKLESSRRAEQALESPAILAAYQ